MRKRPQVDTGDWHITARGARRLFLFHDDADFKTFYALLGASCLEAEVEPIADCLMSNHFHLGLSGATKAITRCMQRLNRAYSGYHNDRYNLSGHAFEQTYYSGLIPSSFILQRVVRYIHLNPVRSRRATAPEQYPWSSYRRLVNTPVEALGPSEKRILESFSPDLTTARTRYKSFVDQDMARPIHPLRGRTTAWEIWQEHFRWILEHALENEVALAPLAPEIVAVHYGSRLGVPPRVMGKALGHSNGRIVSEMIRSLDDRLANSAALRAKVEILQIL